MTRLRLILPMCLLAASACSVHSAHELDLATTQPDQGGVQQIRELGRLVSTSYMAGDIEAIVGLYTPDAVLFPNNAAMVQGTDAIRRLWTLAPGMRITAHRLTPTEIRIDGDHAYEYGVSEMAGERDGTPWGPQYGKYVVVWRRTPQGWRMHLDIWNATPAPAR
jgi:ketosteroid isomerase-like protein